MRFNLSTLLILATAIASINASPLPAEGQPTPEPADILAPRTAEAALTRSEPGLFGPDGALIKRDSTPSTGDLREEEEEEETEVEEEETEEEEEEEEEEEMLQKRAVPSRSNFKFDDFDLGGGKLSAVLKQMAKSGLKKGLRKGFRKLAMKGIKEVAGEALLKRQLPIPVSPDDMPKKKFGDIDFDSDFTTGLKRKFRTGLRKSGRKGGREGLKYGVKQGSKGTFKKAAKKVAKKGGKKIAKKVAKKVVKCIIFKFLC